MDGALLYYRDEEFQRLHVRLLRVEHLRHNRLPLRLKERTH